MLAEGAALTPVGLVTGTAVAAARLAVRAARLSRQRPAETAAGINARRSLPAATEEEGAGPSPAVPLGPLELTRSGDEVVGVSFALGAFERGDPLAGGTTIQPASRLELELVDASDAVQQTLTPPDGARDLLPAEYAYRLTSQALKDLAPGEYRFRATARAPRRDQPRHPPLAAPSPSDEDRHALHPPRLPPVRRRPRGAPRAQAAGAPSTLEEIDIETDDALHRAYLERIPVIHLDGEHVSDYFVDEATLTARLNSDG